MQTRTQLLLLQSLHRRRRLQKAFTLIELMIVVAIVGILAAVAIPKYLEARKNAAANARVGEIVGLSKECATFVISRVGTAPTYATSEQGKRECSETSGTFVADWKDFGEVTFNCLGEKDLKGKGATITVSSDGDLTCAAN